MWVSVSGCPAEMGVPHAPTKSPHNLVAGLCSRSWGALRRRWQCDRRCTGRRSLGETVGPSPVVIDRDPSHDAPAAWRYLYRAKHLPRAVVRRGQAMFSGLAMTGSDPSGERRLGTTWYTAEACVWLITVLLLMQAAQSALGRFEILGAAR